ncbi:MAG: YciI family protein [Ferruginibacter sp.]
MKQLLFAVFIFSFLSAAAQDSTKTKPKEWLGVLTLVEKYKDEKNWTAAENAVVGEHFKRLVKMKEAGVIILAGRMDLPLNDPDMKGLVIFRAKDEKEALQFMMDDPAVKNNIMLTRVFPYGVAVLQCK